MSTTWFYAPDITRNWQLPSDEARHCLTVLRHQIGDEIEVVDGSGHLYTVRLASKDPKHCYVTRVKQDLVQPQRDLQIHLAVAPTKNSSRMEWLLEKITEIGVEAIHFIRTAHAERQQVKLDRLERVVVSAMKQSRKARKPDLYPIVPFTQFIMADRPGIRCMAHLSPDAKPLGIRVPAEGRITLLIGPEGDFSPAELTEAQQNGFQPVSLSPYRLRTETAALVAVEQCNFMHQMKGIL